MTDSTTKAKTVTIKTWICDVCQIASFFDFDEACRHEKQCQGKPNQMEHTTIEACVSKQGKAPITPEMRSQIDAPTDKNTITIDEPSKAPTLPTSESTSYQQVSTRLSAKKIASKLIQCSQVSDNEEVVCVKHVKAPSSASLPTPFIISSRKAVTSKTRTTQTVLHVESKTIKSAKRYSDNNEIPSSNKPQRQKPITKMFVAASQQDPKLLEIATTGRPTQMQEVNWDKDILAENAAAAFQIKRRLCREQEQERNRKRQKQFQQNQETSTEGSPGDRATTSKHPEPVDLSCDFPLGKEGDLKNSIALEKFYLRRQQQREKDLERQRKRQESQPQLLCSLECAKTLHEGNALKPREVRQPTCPAPRFPHPSHTGCSDIQLQVDRRECVWIDDSAILDSCEKLRTTAVFSGNTLCLEAKNYCFASERKHLQIVVDSLHSALNALLIPPIIDDQKGTTLWVDKYEIQHIPEDVCGNENQLAAEKMFNFVKEWKVERQKSHERRKKRHHALANSKRIKRKRKQTEDDDMWGDDKIESDELCSVCLITGPEGSGKSNLVHAVARQSGCKLLEINTTEKRGGQNLRKAIEEATRSHSSLDMLQQRETDLCEQKAIVDSDSEDDADKEGSSLVVVLIDEVDNLFDEEGDSGFWSALSKVTGKSKSPIFLTASTPPKALLNANIRFTHISTSRPEPVECASKMLDICEHESLCFRKDTACSGEAIAKDKMAEVAELCGCDMRSLINQLELFRFSNLAVVPSNHLPSPELLDESKTLWSPFSISAVDPKWVPHDRYSLITIKGRNFKTLMTMYVATPVSNGDIREICLDVTVSGQCCPKARILDDCTIIAVCPPCRLDSKRASRNGNQTKVATIRYANVLVKSTAKLGSVSCSSSYCDAQESSSSNYFPGTCGLAVVNLEYHFPSPSRACTDLFLDSDDEKEWIDENSSKDNASSELAFNDSFEGLQDATVWNEMIGKTLTDGCAAVDESLVLDCRAVNEQDGHKMSLIFQLSEMAELNSDAMFLEDLESLCLPMLSGPVRGFGAALIQSQSNAFAVKNMQNPTTKPPSEERLFTTGWKDTAYFYGDSDSYCTVPATARERRLLKQCKLTRENVWLPDTSFDTLNETISETESLSGDITAASDSFSECSFLTSAFSSTMSELPFILRALAGPAIRPFTDSRILLTRKIRSAASATKWLDCLFDDDAKVRMFGSMSLSQHCISSDDAMSEQLSLDYLPMLRIMGGSEKNAEDAFEQALKNPNLAVSLLPVRRRQTRSSQIKRSRMHYFESFSPLLRRGDVDLTVKELGSDMAARLLNYGN